MNFQLTNKAYDASRRLVQVVIPAACSLYFGLAAIWELPAADKVTGTGALVCTFLGVVLGISEKNYNQSESGVAGVLKVSTDPELGVQLNLDMRGAAVDPLTTESDRVVFKIDRSGIPLEPSEGSE